ncbi:MAG TPA: hydrogenase maturation protease [bacterium]|nr:hydrogenase maturation protease [bacterium]
MNFDEFYAYLSSYPFNEIVILGLGNPNRSDDGAGLYLFKKLKHKHEFNPINFIEAGRTPENYLQKILSYSPRLVIFVDVIRNARYDSIQLLESISLDDNGFTTHSYSISLVEDYLRSAKDLEVKYLAVPVNATPVGKTISPEIKTRISQFLTN